jgi:hypothetical protein
VGLRHRVLIRLIPRRAIDWTERSLPRDAASKLSLDLLRAAVLERIGATAGDKDRAEREEKR